MINRFVLAFVLVGIFGPSADAALKLQLFDGTSTVTIEDNMAGDLTATAGAVTWSGAIGNWVVNVSTGVSEPVIGTPTFPGMDLNSVNVSNAAGTLLVSLTDTDWVGATPPTSPGFDLNIGGTTAGSVLASAWADAGNGEFARTEAIGVLGAFSSPAFSGSLLSGAISATTSPLYSLTMDVLIRHSGPGATSFDFSLEGVPEPSSLLAWSVLGLVALVAGKRSWR